MPSYLGAVWQIPGEYWAGYLQWHPYRKARTVWRQACRQSI